MTKIDSMRLLRTAPWFLLACSVIGLVVPSVLGATYIGRLATRPSFYPVSVPDSLALSGPVTMGESPLLPAQPVRRPRRAVVVVLDGLGHEGAREMRSLEQVRARGQCRKMDVGALSLSRPVYGALSTGVEQDRGGALINDSAAPHVAPSIWEIARQAGLSVAAVSELPWWRELFPRGFATYLIPPRDADYFRLAPPADLLLIHPLYIDEAGHEHGARSDGYRAAVARADRELAGFLGTIDLERDLLVVTADHGHSLRGGHGGREDRVAHVLTCYAGLGVQRRAEIGTMSVTTFSPSLALLLGLRFPAGMRAGDDDLDALWDIVDGSALSAPYLAERREAVERFRAENRAEVARLMPASGGSWAALHHAARRGQATRALPFVALLLALLWVHALGHRRLAGAAGSGSSVRFGWGWILGFGLAAYAFQTGLRGSFDLSSIGTRGGFLLFTPLLGVGVSAAAAGLHVWRRRSRMALAWDVSILSLVGTLLCVAHPAVLGLHLDYPVPPPPLYFFPLFATLFLAPLNVMGLLLCSAGWASRR